MPADMPQSLREQQLREQQLQFANHLRNPELFPAPAGIDERRLQVYRQLFFNNISNLLVSTFPVIRSILPDAQWQALVRDFYTQHRCETPLFPFIAGEFAEYLQHERAGGNDYPFLAELAQYEWSEIALRHSDAAVPDRCGEGRLQLSPLCWPLLFRWPVHRIGADNLLVDPPAAPTCLLVYRNAGGAVKFMESNAATFRLLQLLEDDALQGITALCARLAGELGYPDPLVLQPMIEDTLQQLLAAGVVYLS